MLLFLVLKDNNKQTHTNKNQWEMTENWIYHQMHHVKFISQHKQTTTASCGLVYIKPTNQRHVHSRRLSKSLLRTLSSSWGQQPKTGTFLNVKVPQRVSVPSQGLLALRIKRACLCVCVFALEISFVCKITDISLCFCSQQLCCLLKWSV